MSKTALLLLLLVGQSAAAQKAAIETPPGMVYLKGGRTQVGSDVKTIEEMLQTFPSMQQYAGSFVAETPQVREDVSPFFLMVSEVSSEQYAAFIYASGHRPPHIWGKDATDIARRESLEEQGRLRKAARDEGKTPPDVEIFDPATWWQENWRECEWGVPPDSALMPITFIDYQDARAYARWAGLRLMSEAEYQHASRKGTQRLYPWGDEWAADHCASMELNRAEALNIASYPNGATEDGIHDLSGNVWEWTSTRYMPYDGYKMQTFRFGRGNRRKEIDAMAKWDPNKRVAVGGSIQNARQLCRVTTRRGSDRFQRTSSLGFRCASSAKVGLDRAEVILDDIPHEFRPSTATGPVEYSPELVLAMDRWTTSQSGDSKQGVSLPGNDEAGSDLPPQYAVITAYSYISYVPTTLLPVSSLKDLREASLAGDLVHLGVISTDQELVDPPIGAGTWMVAFRGAGDSPKPKDETPETEGDAAAAIADTQRERAEAALGFDTAVDTLILLDSQGQPVASFPADRLEWGNPKKPTLAPVDRVFTILEEEEEVEYTERWLEFELFVPGKSRKGARFVLGLRFGDGVVDGHWRKS